ncbi:MAG: GNAT family N-acetyltransferase [Spirochaetia bacterium]
MSPEPAITAPKEKIGYRPYRREDRPEVTNILHRTGFLGEDLHGRGLFNDRRLFALFNTECYLRYHAENAFVAFDASDGRVIGYIIGAADSRIHDKLFARRMRWRITLRMFLVSWWRHPESFRQALAWSGARGGIGEKYYDDYPAHLHINILPGYQRMGIGESLMGLFEQRMSGIGVAGIHLVTSNRNLKALPFYRKIGYTMLEQRPGTSWRGLEGHIAIVFAKRIGSAVSHSIIPQPRALELTPGFFVLHGSGSMGSGSMGSAPAGGAFILREARLAGVARHLEHIVKTATGRPALSGEALKAEVSPISLKLDPLLRSALGNEGYRLSVRPDRVEMRAAEPAGIFYAIQTFRQLLRGEGELCGAPCVEIEDAPRFSWRGFMLDEGRFFQGEETVTRLLDLMALEKLNVFHWHLTEDQGWRVEIKRYPELTRIGSVRAGSMSYPRGKPDNVPHSGFYTQEEIRRIVSYASERFITIVPEVELPGHALSALASYPWLGCTGGPYSVWDHIGIQPELLCAGKETTFEFLQGVLEELAELFPGPWFHFGGDEAPKERWKECPACNARLKSLGLDDFSGLQTWMLNRMAAFLRTKGKGTVAWNDALGPRLDPGVRLQFWRGHEDELMASMRKGREVIGSSYWDCYLDHAHSLTPLDRAYRYDPVLPGLDEESAKRTVGLEAPLWTEMVPTPQRLWYQVFPRLCACAETGWSPASRKDWSSFRKRLPGFLRHVRSLGAGHAPLHEANPGRMKRMFGLSSLTKKQTGVAPSDFSQD